MNHDQAAAALTTAAGWRKSSYSQAANDCVEVTTELPGIGEGDRLSQRAGIGQRVDVRSVVRV